jgi:hypothetical protein
MRRRWQVDICKTEPDPECPGLLRAHTAIANAMAEAGKWCWQLSAPAGRMRWQCAQSPGQPWVVDMAVQEQ